MLAWLKMIIKHKVEALAHNSGSHSASHSPGGQELHAIWYEDSSVTALKEMSHVAVRTLQFKEYLVGSTFMR